MSLPANWNTIPIHGKWLKLNGSADKGTVTFTPSVDRVVSSSSQTVITGLPIFSATLDANGEINLSLPATDDTDVTGTPFVYVTQVNLSTKSYTIALAVPVTTVGTLELASATPATVISTPPGTYVQSINGQSGVLTGIGVTEATFSSNHTIAATEIGRRLVATAALTFTVPAVGTLGNGFECELVNDSSGSVTVDGPGSTNSVMDPGDVATLMEVNGKQRIARGASVVIS